MKKEGGRHKINNNIKQKHFFFIVVDVSILRSNNHFVSADFVTKLERNNFNNCQKYKKCQNRRKLYEKKNGLPQYYMSDKRDVCRGI